MELLKEVIRLDKLVYPEKYQTILSNALEWYQKNNDIFTFLFDNGKLIGYICILPVSDKVYEEIRSGTVEQDVYIPLADVKAYTAGEVYNVYIFSVVLDPEYHGTRAVKRMLDRMADKLTGLQDKGVRFDRVLADAVSPKGEKLVNSLGLKKVSGSNHDSMIYEGSCEDMLRSIKGKG